MRSFIFLMLFYPFFVSAQGKRATVPSTPQLFEEGIVSTSLPERDMAISPDGNEMFYTIQVRATGFQTIVHRIKKDGRWTPPEVASFAGQFTDLEPAFSSDGKKLFFCSSRPTDGTNSKDFNIWFTEKQNGIWIAPKNVGSPVNSDANEFYPSVAQNGNLYFTSTRKNGLGKEDIFMARWKNDHYEEPVALDSAVNSPVYEFNAFVSPDEQFILFSSFGRPDDLGGGDLYISVKNTEGHWLPAKNCTLLNSDKLDYCPFVSFDKKTLYFTSERHNLPSSFAGKPITYALLQHMPASILNGNGNIYWVSFDKIFPYTLSPNP